MLLDEIVDQFAVCGQCTEGRLFIFPHEAAVAVNVGTYRMAVSLRSTLTFGLRHHSAKVLIVSNCATGPRPERCRS
jgi:hypothetical protein